MIRDVAQRAGEIVSERGVSAKSASTHPTGRQSGTGGDWNIGVMGLLE
jgi:hypothetical protein